MTLFLGILLAVLKGIGILLLAVLVLVLLILLLPVGVWVRYTPVALTVAACAGPLRFTVYGGAAKQKKKKSPPPAAPPAAKSADSAPQAEEPGLQLPTFLQRRVDAVLALAQSDPVALAERVVCHGGWFFNHLLRGLHLRHVTVFWPITGQDAADTALRYGAAITAANNLLLLLRRHMEITADSLQMEADFTAEHADERLAELTVKATPGILLILVLRLVHRVWVDPTLRPAAKAA